MKHLPNPCLISCPPVMYVSPFCAVAAHYLQWGKAQDHGGLSKERCGEPEGHGRHTCTSVSVFKG